MGAGSLAVAEVAAGGGGGGIGITFKVHIYVPDHGNMKSAFQNRLGSCQCQVSAVLVRSSWREESLLANAAHHRPQHTPISGDRLTPKLVHRCFRFVHMRSGWCYFHKLENIISNLRVKVCEIRPKATPVHKLKAAMDKLGCGVVARNWSVLRSMVCRVGRTFASRPELRIGSALTRHRHGPSLF